MRLRGWARAAVGWLGAARTPGAIGRALAEKKRDADPPPLENPGPVICADAAFRWLCVAQDRSATADGGVARHFSLLSGWDGSYPETTGYIAASFLSYARVRANAEALERGQRMLDWLVSIQRPDGSFAGGTVLRPSPGGVVFNTGQILLGLAAGARQWGDPYRNAMNKAAEWLLSVQDANGAWTRFGSPFVVKGEKAYDTHVAWGLIEAERIEGGRGYAGAAAANVHRALVHQRANGWIDSCCLTDPQRPLTHTLGYALRGLIEVFRFNGDRTLLDRALATAAGAASSMREDGFLSGRLGSSWKPEVSWCCLTGSAQLAACWLLLYEVTGDPVWLRAGTNASGFVRRTLRFDGGEETSGAVKGAWPVQGEYNAYSYPNWAAKFLLDACLLEERIAA